MILRSLVMLSYVFVRTRTLIEAFKVHGLSDYKILVTSRFNVEGFEAACRMEPLCLEDSLLSARGSRVPFLFQSDEDAGFGSDALVEKFKFQMSNYKISMTSRLLFRDVAPDAYDHSTVTTTLNTSNFFFSLLLWGGRAEVMHMMDQF
ncbi:hypothetical protein VNO80_21037 [Phaseolus coccineus]|uniref:Uncharacterized protein n=1 Tax=Phaseolus coccineus TaxID=3886 RepID=A0AAN9M299_PHACN